MHYDFCKDCMYMKRNFFGTMICKNEATANYNPLNGKKKYRTCKEIRNDRPTCIDFGHKFTMR